jgi:hypothetical protein
VTISIVIYDVSACIDAVNWCAEHVLPINWKIDSLWPAEGFTFGFERTEDAVLFSLMCFGG